MYNMLVGNTEITNQYMTLCVTMLHGTCKNVFYQIQDSSALRSIKFSLTCTHWTNTLCFFFPYVFLFLSDTYSCSYNFFICK